MPGSEHSRRPTRLYSHKDGPQYKKWQVSGVPLRKHFPCEMEGLDRLEDIEPANVRQGKSFYFPAVCDECAVRVGLRW